MPTARVREACGIPGLSVETSFLCRDKPAMKQVLRDAGVPCAHSLGASSVEEVLSFVERVGFPVILKPRSSAGAEGTHRVDGLAELERLLTDSGIGQGAPIAVEEFVQRGGLRQDIEKFLFTCRTFDYALFIENRGGGFFTKCVGFCDNSGLCVLQWIRGRSVNTPLPTRR